MVLFVRLLLWSFLLLPSVVLADDPVTIQPEGCFVNMAPRGGVYPIAVSLRNTGPSADGVLVVRTDSFSDVLRTYTYPVSLPTGTDKQILTYPAVTPYAGRVSFSFRGSARAKDVDLPLVDRGEGMQVGMIGDETGALSSLRLNRSPQAVPGTPVQYNDCYARPEDAPDRAAGYQSMSVLVLAAGSERLRPEQWAAIRRWTLDGGSLILLGGAGATYLRVPDAAPLLPLSALQDASLPDLTLPPNVLPQSAFSDFGGPLPGGAALPPGAVAVTTGTLRPGSAALATEGGQVILSRQALGAGTVLLVGFNPLEQPLRGWSGQHDLWLALFHQAVATIPAWSLRQWTAQQTSFTEYDNRYGPGYGGAGGTRISGAQQVNPFRIKLPPIKTIAWLFLAYFILVIPVTYAVLKRLGRLEWAWVTSPLLSIAFAYVFYLFTAQLYQAGMSRRTAGVLVATAGDPDAQFDGFSEMFFPRGGGYAVGVPGAEALEMSPFSAGDDSGYGYYPSGSGGTQMQPLETADTGMVLAPDFQMGNLAFRRLYHTEPVSLGGAITVSLTRDPFGNVAGTVRNGTGQPMTDCVVYEPGRDASFLVGDLAPGESKTVDQANVTGAAAQMIAESPFAKANGPRVMSKTNSGTFLIAHTDGAAFGPALGRDVGGPQSVTILVSVPVAKGAAP